MATEFCIETIEDRSDECRSFWNQSIADLKSWYAKRKNDCKSCTCNGWPWRWPCCVKRALCLGAVSVAYVIAIGAIAVAYVACLASAIIRHIFCYVIAELIEFFEDILVFLIGFFRPKIAIICNIFGLCCNPATVSGKSFTYPTRYIKDDRAGKPKNSDGDIFASRTNSPADLRLQYLGTNSIHISDGDTTILIDPYFTRPKISQSALVLCQTKMIKSNQEIIKKVLGRDGANITSVDAIVLTHSHYDHALDVVEVAKYIADQNHGVYPKIIGSKSTFHICRGGGIPEKYLMVVDQFRSDSEIFSFNRFDIQLFRGKHINLPVVGSFINGSITTDLVQPANLFDFKEGGIFSIYIQHECGNILNLGSANFLKGALDSVNNVDFLILGIAGFEKDIVHAFDNLDMNNKDNFYSEVVVKTRPSQVYFSHWDDFNEPLDREYPKWYYNPIESRDFFISKNPDLPPLFLPVGGYIDLPINRR